MIVSLVGVLAAVTDGKDSFWAQRPFLAQVLIGLLTLALTVATVDRLKVARENRAWRRIAIVAYRSLARASRDVTTGLTALYADLARASGPKPEGGTQGKTRDLDPLDEVRVSPPGKAALRIFGGRLPSDEAPGDDLLPAARLRRLLSDREWCAFATTRVSAMVDENRDIVAKWAPLMMSADEPRLLLDAFASLNDELFILAIVLRRASDRRLDDRELQSALRVWRTTDGKARILTNALWQHANGGRYSLLIPPALAQIGVERAFSVSGSISGWPVTEAAPVDRDPFSPM